MDVAITGSSGLIGTALMRRLRDVGHNPVPVTRSGDTGIHWDPARHEIDAPSLEGIGAVVHLAGEGIAEGRWTSQQKRLIGDSRVEGTTLLAKTLAGLTRPPSVLLSGSAIGYYGDRGDEHLDETSPPGSGFLADVCVRWEGSAAPAAEAGIRVAYLRTGIVLTAEGGVLKRLLPLYRMGVGGKLGSGGQYMSWIGIDDEVGIICWLLDHEVAGPVNLTAPNPVRNSEFNKVMGRVLRRPSFLPVPKFAPRLLMGGQLADDLLFASACIAPRALQSSGYPFSHPMLDDALRATLGQPGS